MVEGRRGREHRERQPDILSRLEQAVEAIHDSETFRSYLDVQSRFHRYSFGNVMLILAQRPDATRVAGYNTWLKMHRYVKKGERGIKIIVPMSKKVVDEAGNEEKRVFFGTGNVFDYAQTDGEPLPEVETPVLTGQEGVGLLVPLYELAVSEGISAENVSSDEMGGHKMGDFDPQSRVIRVREESPRQMVKTFAHELGHYFAGHTTSDPESETSAEAIAYVVCAHFGVDTGERSFPYIAVWSQERKVLQGALGTIQRVSAQIIDRLEGKAGEGEPRLS